MFCEGILWRKDKFTVSSQARKKNEPMMMVHRSVGQAAGHVKRKKRNKEKKRKVVLEDDLTGKSELDNHEKVSLWRPNLGTPTSHQCLGDFRA